MDYNLKDIKWPHTPFELMDHLILAGKRGSEAHGTFIPNTDPNGIDDRDVMGLIIQSPRGYIGLDHWEGADAIQDVWDVVLYDVRKAVSMLAGSNPNIISILWLEPEDYIHLTPEGQKLIDNRDLFICRKRFYDAFCGYAYGQFKRMTSGQGDPKRGFMGEKRKKLVEKYGFDCKNAAHCVRLLHMGIEFLKDGKLHVRRTWDAEMLKEIKTGKWILDTVIKYTQDLFEKVDLAYTNSSLQENTSKEKINDLLESLIISFWFQ